MGFRQYLLKIPPRQYQTKIYRIFIIINILAIFLLSHINIFTIGSGFAESNFRSTVREPEKTTNKPVIATQSKPTSSGSIQTPTQTNKGVQNYFSYVFKKNTYDVKTLELQKLLISLKFFTGTPNGIYDNKTMESVYQYQLAKKIITSKSPIGLRGYLGQTTRTALNKDYAVFLQKPNGPTKQSIEPKKTSTNKSKGSNSQTVAHAKTYFQSHNFAIKNIAGTGVYVGNSDIDLLSLSGKIDLPVVVESKKALDGQNAQVQFVEGTVLKTEDGNVFSGVLKTPTFLDVSEAQEIKDQKIISVVDVGGNDKEIYLQNSNGDRVSSKVKMPAPGAQLGDELVINYSQDGNLWQYMTKAKVFLENNSPYVQFETSHFTFFSIGRAVSSLSINSGALSTSSSSVSLNINVAGATQMRFSNTEAGLAGASWVAYATGYNWTITAVNGVQTVYAEFTGLYGDQFISDSIVYDSTSASNLLAWYNGTMNATTIVDTKSTYPLSGLNGVSSINLGGEQTLFFNGTSQYGQRAGAGITAYPFSFSAWINANSIAATDTILSIGNSATTTTYWSLQLVNGAPSVTAANTTAFTATYGAAISTGKRYHVTAVFASATSRKVYLNGQQTAQNASSVTFANTNQQLRLGAKAGSTVANYFHGYIDDARVYNKALTDDEIMTMYQSRTVDSQNYLNIGNFTINNDAPNTFTTAVTLNMSVSGATQMRFANTEGGLTSASWVAYADTYSWTLDSVIGNKTVYAQFTDGTDIYSVQDNIALETVPITPLRVLLSSAMSSTNLIDSTANGYTFTGYGGLSNISDNGDLVMSFNGTSKYADRGTVGITAYPFTISTWIKAPPIAGTDGLVMMGNSAATNVYFGIQLVNGAPSIVARNTTTVTATSTNVISTGEWYHVVGVFSSATSRTLYVNAVSAATSTTSVTFSSTNQQVRLGRYNGTTTNYYSGYMDDTRIYSAALTLAQIQALYTGRVSQVEKPTAKVVYSTTNPTAGSVVATLTGYSEAITITNNGGSNSYTFTGNGSFTFMFKDIDGNVGSAIAYVDWITGTVTVQSPGTLSLGSLAASTDITSLENSFGGVSEYFKVLDNLGHDNGYYTTLTFSDLQDGSKTIPKSNIYIKSLGGIDTLDGTANNNVSSDLSTSYVNVSSPLSFLKRPTIPNKWRRGTYGSQIAIKVDVPGYQSIGNYAGTITYTVYEN